MLFISFIFIPTYPLEGVAGTTSIELGIPHGQQPFKYLCWLHTKTGPSKVRDAVTPPRLWTTSGSLSCGFSQQDLPHQSFIGHSGYMAELTYCFLSIRRSGSTFRALRILQLRTLLQSVTPGA